MLLPGQLNKSVRVLDWSTLLLVPSKRKAQYRGSSSPMGSPGPTREDIATPLSPPKVALGSMVLKHEQSSQRGSCSTRVHHK